MNISLIQKQRTPVPSSIPCPTLMETTCTAFSLLVLCGTMRAQPTLTLGQYTMVLGDHYELFEFNGGISPSSGANVTWNYANLTGEPWFSKDVVDPSTAAGFALFPSATAALQWLPYNEFHRSSADKEEHLGFYSSPGEYSLCSDPRTEMEYPFTLGSSFTDSMVCSEIGPSPRTRTGVFTVTCTAYGSLILPNATYSDCLLLHRTWSYVDEYSGDPNLGYSVGETYSIVKAGIGQPLLSHTTSVYTQGGGSIDNASGFRLGDFSTGLRPAACTDNAIAYPNPTTDILTVTTGGIGHATITLHTTDGREVMRERTANGAQQHVLSLQHLLSGIYLLRMEAGGRTNVVRVLRM